MWIYILLFGVSILGSLPWRKRKAAWGLSYIFFCFFFILRTHIGTDWPIYEKYFQNINLSYEVNRMNFEIGYHWLNVLFSYFNMPFQFVSITISLFLCIVFFKTTKKLELDYAITFILGLFYLFYPTLEALRQSVAIFLFYYSLTKFKIDNSIEIGNIHHNTKLIGIKKQIDYAICNIIGMFFHRTSGLFASLFYFYKKNKIFKYLIISLFGFWGIFKTLFEKIMANYLPFIYHRYIYYVREPNTTIFNHNFISLKFVEYTIALCILLLLHNKNQNEEIALNLIEIGVLIQLFLSNFLNASYRLLYYTDIGLIIFYSSIYKRVKKSTGKLFYELLIILYVSIRFFRAFPFNNIAFQYHILW